MGAVVTNILPSTKLEFLSQVDKYRAHVFSINVRCFEYSVVRFSPEVVSIIRAFIEHSFSTVDLMLSHTDHDLIFGVILGQSDGGVNLGHEAEFPWS